MTTQFRILTGGTALAAGLWFLTAASAAPTTMAKDSYRKAAEADIAQIQKYLAICEMDPKDAKRYGPTAKAMAAVLAVYGEALGDAELKKQALKVIDAIAAKNYSGALTASKSLAVKPGTGPLPPGGTSVAGKVVLDEVMSPFRVAKVGGYNIEKDIRDLRDGKIPIKPADVEVLAARTAVILEFASTMPNDKAKVNKASTDEWTKLSKDSVRPGETNRR